MNPRIAKEIRVQMPAFGFVAVAAAAVLAIKLVQSPFNFINTGQILTGIYFLSCIVMAATVFGNEFQHRTLSLLVSQPIDRKKIWREKMLVLAVLCALVLFIVQLAMNAMDMTLVHLRSGWMVPDRELSFVLFMILVPIVFCGTTPYLTLISRSTIGGVVFAVFGAGMLLAAGDAIWTRLGWLGFDNRNDKLIFGTMGREDFFCALLFVPYTAVLYWLGYRKFLGVQVIDSQAVEVSLPASWEAPFEKFSGMFSSPFARLLFKELRLQQISLVLSLLFCVCVAAEALLRKPGFEIWAFFFAGTMTIYLGLFPVIVGATAITEEKVWGLKDWHLTLPPSLKQQWRVKWMVALALNLGLGAGLVSLLIHLNSWFEGFSFNLPELVLYCVLITGFALYAASISASTIRALLATFLMMFAFAIALGTLRLLDSVSQSIIPLLIIVPLIAMVDFYLGCLRLLWNVIVAPVWWTTHSVEKTARAARWADVSINSHLATIMLIITAGCWMLLALRFAKTNFRRSDLVKRSVLKQLLILLLATAFLGLTFLGSTQRLDSSALPHWSFLPDIP